MYYRSEKLADTDFFLKRAQEEKPKLGYKRPGATIGGPVVENRTFFFFAVEWLYDRFPEPITSTVPTEAMRRGDFSALLPLGIQIYNPYLGPDGGRPRGARSRSRATSFPTGSSTRSPATC